MESQKVDLFIISNVKYFESHQLPQIRERLVALEDAKWPMVQVLQFKDPNTSIIVSLFSGHWGIDRFLIGDVGLGVCKLLTCGGLGIWTIVDWFMIMGDTREKNLATLQQVLF